LEFRLLLKVLAGNCWCG